MEPHIAGFHTDFCQGLAAAVGLFVTTDSYSSKIRLVVLLLACSAMLPFAS
jgi:hypothetical protein